MKGDIHIRTTKRQKNRQLKEASFHSKEGVFEKTKRNFFSEASSVNPLLRPSEKQESKSLKKARKRRKAVSPFEKGDFY